MVCVFLVLDRVSKFVMLWTVGSVAEPGGERDGEGKGDRNAEGCEREGAQELSSSSGRRTRVE